jgi:hypothetical protein
MSSFSEFIAKVQMLEIEGVWGWMEGLWGFCSLIFFLLSHVLPQETFMILFS